MPPFNFNATNPQKTYFQPIVPPPVFPNSQQQQQAPFQFNPNMVNPVPSFAQQPPPPRISPYTQENHSHSNEYGNNGHGHSH